MAEKKVEEEGARAFARSLELIDDGNCHVEATKAQNALMKVLQAHSRLHQDAVSGEITLKIRYTVEADVCGIKWDLKVTEPKTKRNASVLFLTKGGNLTPDNPRQQKLPGLQEVKRPTNDTNEAGGAGEANSV